MVASIGVFFIGAVEVVFILGVLGITILVRRDFSRRFLIMAGVLVGLVGLWAILGYLIPLYEGNLNVVALIDVIKGNEGTVQTITSGRWEVIVERLKSTSILGYGYSLSTVGGQIVHNIPLIISHQIGPVAGIAWLFVTVYCLIKTKWKYAWVAVMAMGVWDHYLWTQLTPYWWILIGASTASNIKSDLIFRRVNETNNS